MTKLYRGRFSLEQSVAYILLKTKKAGARGGCAQKGPGREAVAHKKGRGERLLRSKRAGARGCCAQKGPGREAVAHKMVIIA